MLLLLTSANSEGGGTFFIESGLFCPTDLRKKVILCHVIFNYRILLCKFCMRNDKTIFVTNLKTIEFGYNENRM